MVEDKIEKFYPFNDWFFKAKCEVSEQEKEQIKAYLEGVNSCFEVKNNQPLTSYTQPNILDFPVMKNLREKIISILDPMKLTLDNSWVQSYVESKGHNPHTHFGSVYSGIIYVVGKENPTMFLHPLGGNVGCSKRFNSNYKHPIEENTLLLFPSFFTHYVEKHTFKSKRIVRSFNTLDKVDG